MSDRCLACSRLVHQPMVSISHTIRPGGLLCPDCGRRESHDPLWADGRRVGFERDAVARKAIQPKEFADAT